MDATRARNSVWIISHCMQQQQQHNAAQSAAALSQCKAAAAAEHVQGCCCTCTVHMLLMHMHMHMQLQHEAHQIVGMLRRGSSYSGGLRILEGPSIILNIGTGLAQTSMQRVLSCKVYSAQ